MDVNFARLFTDKTPPTFVSSGISKDAIEPAAAFSSLSPWIFKSLPTVARTGNSKLCNDGALNITLPPTVVSFSNRTKVTWSLYTDMSPESVSRAFMDIM